MITKNHSLIQAEVVLALVMNHEKAKEIECFVECYQNGREQGYQLWDQTKGKGMQGIYIAECRNSDEIAVYVGEYAMQSVSHDAYQHRHYFSHDDYAKAAEFVIDTALHLFPVGRFNK